ncbi:MULTISPECIES: TspO/MBR family protein [unclassified Rhizobium]|uniref:TspO/MBR family protein n=1 Tax=unclassified Rhizobium TaxID=2613769 RepID=UPI001FDF99AA|nr:MULTISPECIES: TspO/MBR family protein [unclassified Rhizobium]
MKRQESWMKAGIAVAPVIIVLLLGQWATFPNIPGWYAGLVKPVFNPPNWIFGPVWTCLYALMALAVWRIWMLPAEARGRSPAFICFYLQLTFNAAWSWAFFALHSPALGLVDIIPQWILILETIRRFHRLDRLAAYALLPLAFWVAFAFALNFEIWRLNG